MVRRGLRLIMHAVVHLLFIVNHRSLALMRVIYWVPDKFTTRSRQAHTFTTKNQWISFNFVRDTFTTDFYLRLVRERVMK
jgi:hypothetical protein